MHDFSRYGSQHIGFNYEIGRGKLASYSQLMNEVGMGGESENLPVFCSESLALNGAQKVCSTFRHTLRMTPSFALRIGSGVLQGHGAKNGGTQAR